MQSLLTQNIQREKDRLIHAFHSIPVEDRDLKIIEGTGGKVSPIDLISYQIGWGVNLIRWYEEGIDGKKPEMPGDGFSKWDYVGIANLFYQKYAYDGSEKQIQMFLKVVERISEIVEIEERRNHLDQTGIWEWCKLSSGKQWPLSKWIQVNTVAPYKRATILIRQAKYKFQK